MSCLNRIGSRTHRIRCASRHAGLLAVMLVFVFPRTAAWADTPQGQWLIDGRVVVQIFSMAESSAQPSRSIGPGQQESQYGIAKPSALRPDDPLEPSTRWFRSLERRLVL
jgi:hypothetical protein